MVSDTDDPRPLPSASLDAALMRAQGFHAHLEKGLADADLSLIAAEEIAEARRLVKDLLEQVQHAVANPGPAGPAAEWSWSLYTRGRKRTMMELVKGRGPEYSHEADRIPLFSLDPDAPAERLALEMQWAEGPPSPRPGRAADRQRPEFGLLSPLPFFRGGVPRWDAPVLGPRPFACSGAMESSLGTARTL